MMEKNRFLPKKGFLSLCLKMTISILQTNLVWVNPECNTYNHINSYIKLLIYWAALWDAGFCKILRKKTICNSYSHSIDQQVFLTFNRFFIYMRSKLFKKHAGKNNQYQHLNNQLFYKLLLFLTIFKLIIELLNVHHEVQIPHIMRFLYPF